MYNVANKYKPFLHALDAIGSCLFFWTKWKKLESPRKILVIRLEHIGDCILTTPTISALKEAFPNSSVDVLIRPANKIVFENNSDVKEVLTINAPWFSRGSSVSYKELFSFVKQNFRKYDLVLDVHADPRNILLAKLVGKFVVGKDIRGLGFLLNKTAEHDDKKHIIKQQLQLVEAVKSGSYPAKMSLFPKSSDLKKAESLLAGKERPFIIINPGTGRPEKFWLNDRWAELIGRLQKKPCGTIIFTGAPNEHIHVEEILKKTSPEHLDLVGKTSLGELFAVASISDLIIAPDTGIIHAARAMGTKSIGLYGPVDPGIWGYNDGPNSSVIVRSSGKMEDITVDMVLECAERKL